MSAARARRLLGVDQAASPAEVTRAYRALARRLHPDTGGPTADPARFAEVSAAYAVLSGGPPPPAAPPRRGPGPVRIPVHHVRRPRG